MTSLSLALADAAANCTRENATATITLKSGVQVSGKLQRPRPAGEVHLKKDDGGWATILEDEVAAVETTPSRTRPRL